MDSVTDTPSQEFSFQAEIKQLLHLLAHSLYQSREIALRELISNASDALDKQRYLALADESKRDEAPLEIMIEGRADARELILRDNGVGMTHDELVTNLGTIAHSGSREFLKAAAHTAKDGPAALSLIGQFGVGFYSAFMIADRVRVRTRSDRDSQAWEWESDGTGSFRVRPITDQPRGTEIILHLKEDAQDFASDFQIAAVVRRYSSFVPHPIRLASTGEVINSQKPIWVEPRSQVTEEQYLQFYQHLTHHAEEKPLWHIHVAADSPIQFRALVYCPPTSSERLGIGPDDHGLSLCAKRVLVQQDCRDLLPEYLRFLRGIVDSEDLPLNVSRETLQDNTVIRRIKNSLIKHVLDKLDKQAEDSPGEFLAFYRQFGTTLKEGIARDPLNRDRIARLLRFTSTEASDPEAPTSLAAYLQRAKEGQPAIYYLGGPDLAAVRKSPNLEIFTRRGLEVLFLSDPVDEFVLSTLGKFEGKPLVSIDAADVPLPTDESVPEASEKSEKEPESEVTGSSPGLQRVLGLFRDALGTRVTEVRASKRLTESPCCLVNADGQMSTQLQRLLKLANKDFVSSGKILEVNPSSPLIKRLGTLSATTEHDTFIRDCALQLWGNALLLEGSVTEPEAWVERTQRFMEEAAERRSPIIH
ncbi:MAG: molecular chaperone HtpG [Isosphaeraceae bacterium]